MGKKILITIIILLILSGLGFYYVYDQSKKKIAKFEALRSGTEEQIQYVEDCEKVLLDTGRDYVICSLDSDGRLYLTNDKRVFKPDEYLNIQVNLQKLNDYFDPYYACVYSNFPYYPTEFPGNYYKSVLFENLSKEGNIVYEDKTCSRLLLKKDYHHIPLSGFVANLPGKYSLISVYVFPEMNFTSKEDFFNNLDKAIMIFNMIGEIR